MSDRTEALQFLDAAWKRGEQSGGTDTAIPIQTASAVTHALLAVEHALGAIHDRLEEIAPR